MCFFFFFFQAEDGIRDVERSRGLGDVYKRQVHGELVPLAEEVIKLTAVCSMCGADASFSKRITAEQQVELIGGDDIYKPVCRSCFHKDYISPFKEKAGKNPLLEKREIESEKKPALQIQEKENSLLNITETKTHQSKDSNIFGQSALPHILSLIHI
eukprot:TRINITY_DN17694_c0_g1_i2.p1 TRINITY_DN17694_c0_g1~~TRINITY_DN17694_c0_g1_i2.p1  ORF type:complete len:157 (+),score=52.42 TRINITY_DN17694_c0_g1_i2:86-556(+)